MTIEMDDLQQARLGSPKRGFDDVSDDDYATPPTMSSPRSPQGSRPGSPSKRTRQGAPPVLVGPLAFALSGNLEPKYAPPNACSRPGVHRVLPAQATVRLHLPATMPLLQPGVAMAMATGNRVIECDIQAVLAAADRKVILIFINEHTVELAALSEHLFVLPEVQRRAILVSGTAPLGGALPIPAIEDPQGALARECRVLDPVGGGRVAAPCLVFLQDCEVQATMLLGRRASDIVHQIRSFG